MARGLSEGPSIARTGKLHWRTGMASNLVRVACNQFSYRYGRLGWGCVVPCRAANHHFLSGLASILSRLSTVYCISAKTWGFPAINLMPDLAGGFCVDDCDIVFVTTLIGQACEESCTEIFVWFLSNWTEYDRSDYFPINYEPNGIPSGLKSAGKQ